MSRHPHFSAYLALAAVCFFWGTTYLGIRMSLESFPPLLLVCARFVLSGSLMLAAITLRGGKLPRGRDLRAACLSGVLVLGIGNGALVFAEQWVPSGLACLIITCSPFWMVGAEALLPGGVPLHLPTILGMLVGLGGAALLFAPDVHTHTFHAGLLSGFLVLQFGMAGWAFGSIYQRRQVTATHPIVIGAVQQLAAGLSFLPLLAIFHEHPVHWSTARRAGDPLPGDVWLHRRIQRLHLRAGPSARGGCLNLSLREFGGRRDLGWLFYREPFGAREAAAMAIIFVGVALVKRYSRAPASARRPQPSRLYGR